MESALWQNWVVLMSGVVGLLIGISLRVGRRVSATVNSWSDIPDFLFIGVGLIALFFAGYVAWRDEHQKLATIEKRLAAPDFKGIINTTATANYSIGNHKNLALLIVDATITNPHGPASAAVDWAVSVVIDGKKVEGELLPPSGQDVVIPGDGLNVGKSVVLSSQKRLPNITESALAPGDSKGGWLAVVFSQISAKEFSNAEVVVELKDVVEGKTHSFRRSVYTDGNKDIVTWPSQIKNK